MFKTIFIAIALLAAPISALAQQCPGHASKEQFMVSGIMHQTIVDPKAQADEPAKLLQNFRVVHSLVAAPTAPDAVKSFSIAVAEQFPTYKLMDAIASPVSEAPTNCRAPVKHGKAFSV